MSACISLANLMFIPSTHVAYACNATATVTLVALQAENEGDKIPVSTTATISEIVLEIDSNNSFKHSSSAEQSAYIQLMVT